jgi:phosphoglycolate phosphatase
MNKFKLAIFDLDGTLVNSYPAIICSVNYTLEKINFKKLNLVVIKRAVGWGDKALLAPFVSRDKLAEAIEIYRKHHKKSLVEKTSFMPYAKRLLSYLKNKNYKLAIASNRPAKFSDILLKHLEIKKLFDYILCKDEIRFGKPHPSILNKIIRSVGTNKKEAIYIGDMAIDVETGRRARVKTFAVATGSSTWAELKKENPDFLGENLSKLFKIL